MQTVLLLSLQQRHSFARELRRSLAVLPWTLYVLLAPIYVLPSGLPQPADWLLLLGSVAVVAQLASRASVSHTLARLVQPLLWFVWYSWVITAAWAWVLGDASLLVYPLYYTFNCIVVVAGLLMIEKHRYILIRAVARALVIVLVALSTALVGRLGEDAGRAVLFFNNPNQLGYFGLLAVSILGVCYSDRIIGKWTASIGIAGALLLVLGSQSKASMVASLVAVLTLMGRRGNFRIGIVLGLITILLLAQPQGVALVSSALQRIGTIGRQSDDSWSGRGYDRIIHHPEYLLFGAAEGAYWRFSSSVEGELHSSLGTVIFAYGIPGTLSVATLLWRLWRVAQWRMVWLVPAALYGLTHQGLRFRWFWILLMIVAGTGILARARESDRGDVVESTLHEDERSPRV